MEGKPSSDSGIPLRNFLLWRLTANAVASLACLPLHRPDAARIRAITERTIGRVDQRLSAIVEQDAEAHPVHVVAEAHTGFRVGETKRTAHADMAESRIAHDAGRIRLVLELAVVHGLHVAERETRRDEKRRVFMRRHGATAHAGERVLADELAAAIRERLIHARQTAPIGDAVRRTDLGGMSLARVEIGVAALYP